jgi:hypothetical protein
MSETQIRCPRMQGFPKQISGSILIRSSSSSRLIRACYLPCHLWPVAYGLKLVPGGGVEPPRGVNLGGF